MHEAGMSAFEPPPDVEGAVELVSASVVLASVEESGPNYLLPKAPEPVKSRRKRLRVDEAARQAGQAILETGTRVEIFGEEERWWPATIMERTEDTDGRLVHRVQYTNFEGDRYWHVLDDEQWRRVADTGPEVDHARAGAGDAALRDGASLAASRLMRWDNARGETAGGASETTGGAGSAETTGQAGSAPDLNWPGRRRVRRSAAMELLRAARRNEDEQREALLPDDVPMLLPHGAKHSRALREVRRRLREYLSELAERGQVVPMMRVARGLHPTVRWTIGFGEWLALTRIRESKASRWLAAEQASARGEEAVVRAGRGAGTVQVMLDNMANHVWREVWPAMPADDKHYCLRVNKHVMGLFDGGGGGMHQMAAMVGEAEGRAAQLASAASGAGEQEAQQAVRDKARAAGSKRTMEELRAATTHPCTKQLLYRVGQEQLQDVLLSEPFEVNVAIVLNAYICLARLTACRPGMATNDADDLAATSSHWRVR